MLMQGSFLPYVFGILLFYSIIYMVYDSLVLVRVVYEKDISLKYIYLYIFQRVHELSSVLKSTRLTIAQVRYTRHRCTVHQATSAAAL